VVVAHSRLVGGDVVALHVQPADAGGDFIPDTLDLDEIVVMMNRTCPRLRVVAPVSKRLACGDVGVGGLAELGDLVAAVESLLRHHAA
jgi:phosphopantothenoylcysteine decarboxylase